MSAVDTALVLALLAQVFFTFATMLRAGRARFRAARQGRITGDIALGHDGWPDDVRQRGNNMNNQFETPTLFYALGLLALAVKANGVALALLAWIYVAFRVAHMVVHTGSNRVLVRFRLFVAGVTCLMAMAALVLAHVLLPTVF